MAKRKRLEVPKDTVSPVSETESGISSPRARIPIADVAGEVAGRAALEDVAREMTAAEEEGRIVKKLPLDQVVVHHLSRDRLVLDEEEMAALTASIAARGQQTPIEVVRLSDGRFGLISGMRRVVALRRLGKGGVRALIKSPETSHSAYQAMVEENEIRAGLSFFERAQIAVAAAEQGVYPDPKAAVKELFAHAPKAKRSKITKFVVITSALGDSLTFPASIPEHLGLALAQALQDKPRLASAIDKTLKASPPADAAAERRVLEAALKTPVARPEKHRIAPGVTLEARAGRAIITGKGVDQDFLDALRDWAGQRVG